MRFKEFSEGANIGAGTSIATVATALGVAPNTPWLQKMLAVSPGTASFINNIIAGNAVGASFDALETTLGNANLLPGEMKQAVNTFSALRSAHGLATSATPLAIGAAPLLALAGATQQASTADMGKHDNQNVFGTTARIGKQIGDWANKVSGRDDKYAQMRAQQRADLQAK